MLNHYPSWKNLLVAGVLLVGLLYALPNLFSQDPVIEITGTRGEQVGETLQQNILAALERAQITIKSSELKADRLQVRFKAAEDQLAGQDAIAKVLPAEFTHALTLSPDIPGWLTALGGRPMNLGLDLRGGIHVLIDVDMDAAIEKTVERHAGNIRTALRDEKIRYVTVKESGNGVDVRFKDADSRDQAEKVLRSEFRDLATSVRDEGEEFYVRVFMSQDEERAARRLALEQNITTLRNRVNALGVAEPVIQQQGDRRIVVELPGVQDPGKVKDLLGATATLEYRLVHGDPGQAFEAESSGRVPPGAALYHERNGQPILLKRQVIVTGDEMTSASSGFDQQSGQPAVYVNLDSKGARRMRNVTTENVGKPMAVVFKEKRTVGRDSEGKPIRKWVEEVINVATIREAFGRRFQTTGLDNAQEAHQLALLLRAGALAAPINIVEERTIGPSLGQDNIDQGMVSVMVGLLAVMVVMAVYYKVFGMVANLALMANLVLIVAILSMLQATLTVPGIAGIVLTVGMAVDANVLIYERIREELSIGSTPQASIHAGYERAFSSILDANVTTLIAAVVLFSIGSGPVRGFAVTLAIGIATSMFTALMGTRAVINLVYGRKRVAKLAI
ncbi:MAG TPA: protein translocase subunit SecD [Gammaproteobacteria bacterium]|nr:protein translocase subunit SecD [Gammaproteobacteria bacterium]MCP5435346.1 protein translocase subunit SecD [Chromatiaceae bacterium]MCW5585772.1 protein translocase subunit SecD [Chromatiales bacterium]HOP16081.1 protein translocase subunit SecD [Gammaproteobacteria bacterium]HPQ26205.1 protein translocase subunit SecD [Gammaproteobacteria bacterium]